MTSTLSFGACGLRRSITAYDVRLSTETEVSAEMQLPSSNGISSRESPDRRWEDVTGRTLDATHPSGASRPELSLSSALRPLPVHFSALAATLAPRSTLGRALRAARTSQATAGMTWAQLPLFTAGKDRSGRCLQPFLSAFHHPDRFPLPLNPDFVLTSLP